MNRPVRPELPPMPPRIAALPVDHRGFPVPWFAAWLKDGRAAERGKGTPDHRITFPGAATQAAKEGRCWVCGTIIHDSRCAFVIGPMCAVNRNSAEPPSHVDCGDWAARACPFLSRPHARRREAGMPGETAAAPGIMLGRNPGVTAVWVTRRGRASAHMDPRGNGLLFNIGDPVEVRWYAEGRGASRDEIVASVDSGLPALREVAEQDGPSALAELARMTDVAMALVPA